MKYKYFFTITAGRTGSAWLTSFLADNLKIKSVHEPLEIDDFGVRMPDIKLMRTFNMRGNTTDVQNFYRRKFDEISRFSSYAETNHTLSKCGLVENIVKHQICSHSCLIVLRRDFAKQCVSYITRGDFQNITIDWQWYLHQNYRNNIVSYAPFENYGLLGKALWYVYEMDARQRYYEQLYMSKIRIISTMLEELTTEVGAKKLLEDIGHHGKPILPEIRNQNRAKADDALLSRANNIIAKLQYDGDSIVNQYLESGRTLHIEKETSE
jgi:hypothetical protein